MRNLYIVAISMLCVPLAAQGLNTDRPDQTESAWTVPHNALQIETGAALSSTGNNLTLNVLQNVWRYAPVPHLEARLVSGLHFSPNETKVPQSGFDDLEVGLKYQFVRGKTPMALLTHIILPTSDDDSRVGAFWKVLWAHDLGPYLNVGCNVGLEVLKGRSPQYNYSLSVSMNLTEKLGYYLEPFGTLGDIHAWDTGLTCLVSPNVQLDFSLGFSLMSSYNYFAFGCSWRIPH